VLVVAAGVSAGVSVELVLPDGVGVVVVGLGVSEGDGVVVALALGVGVRRGFLVCVGEGVDVGVTVWAGMTTTLGGGGGRTSR
jgi:hypothetical protein